MLELKNIKKSFGGVQAVKGSNFKIEKNKITALIGPNGAGKTTLFDIIAGLLRPDSGQVFFDGKDITNKQPFEIANLGISRTFQQVRLFHNLNIQDHLAMIEDNQDVKCLKNIFSFKKPDKDKYEKIIKDFGINLPIDTIVSELSYGQRKLLQIAMALHKQHKLVMFDEPVAGVNKVIQTKIEDLLIELKKQGETILLIDHDMEVVRRLCDYVIALDAGVVIAQGTPDKVLSDPKILQAYLGE